MSYENSDRALLKLKIKNCPQTESNSINVHPNWDLNDSLIYNLDEIWIKFPSEHSVDGEKYKAELQYKHVIDNEKSIVKDKIKERINNNK